MTFFTARTSHVITLPRAKNYNINIILNRVPNEFNLFSHKLNYIGH